MTTWSSDELTKIGKAEELPIASLRSDGTLRNPVTIWVVRVDDALYVRSVNGRGSDWFRGAQTLHQGHIRAGGVGKDVSFVEDSAPKPTNGWIVSTAQSTVVTRRALSATSTAPKPNPPPFN